MNVAIAAAIRAKKKAIQIETHGIGIELLRVEPGSFDLGSPSTEAGRHPSEGPIRRVTLTRPFYLGKYPVTQGQYTAVTGKAPARPAGPNVAIERLSYVDTLEFCDDLTKATGVTVGLPFEAQWEYACRAGTTTRFWSGDTEEDLARVGWYRENSEGHAWEVGLKPANPWGFHDMHGNVYECCRDALPYYGAISLTDPVGKIDEWERGMRPSLPPLDQLGPIGLLRGSKWEGMMRGGFWGSPADYCRSASHVWSIDEVAGMGLRIAIAG